VARYLQAAENVRLSQIYQKGFEMPNFNDAKITSLYVGEPGAVKDIQDDAPNSPAGHKWNVTLEMVAGEGVLGTYDVITTCTDVTECKAVAAFAPGGPLNGSGTFQNSPPWKHDGAHWVFNHSVTLPPPPAADKGHVYRYTAALHNSNGQIVSLRQSDPFILL
jgi:hypothetical protein